MMATVNQIGATKLWGNHSLNAGELIGFAIGIAIMMLKPFGSWSFWLGLAIIFVAMALF